MDFQLSESLSTFQASDKSSYTIHDVDYLLREVTPQLGHSPEAVIDGDIFSSLETLVLGFHTLNKHHKRKVIELVTHGLHSVSDLTSTIIETGDTESFAAQKLYLEVYAYLTHVIITYLGMEKMPHSAKKADDHSLEIFKTNTQQIELVLDSVIMPFKLHLNRIFITTPERDLFVAAFTRPIYLLMEDEKRMKVPTLKAYMFKVISLAVKSHGHSSAAQSAIMQNLNYFGHLSGVMAELLQHLNDVYDYPQLTEEVLREVSNKEYDPNDTKSPKQVSLFIVKISELLPLILLKQMMLVSRLLSNSSFTLRLAVVEACGNIVLDMAKKDEEFERHKQHIFTLLDLLTDRFRDQNPYVRSKAIQAVTRLCEIEGKFNKLRTTFLQLAIRSLNDRSALCRRNALKLLGKLITTHPFGALHGTQLSLTSWKKRLADVKAELEKLEPGENTEVIVRRNLEESTNAGEYEQEAKEEAELDVNAIAKIKLTEQYYNDAIEFIEMVQKGVVMATQLLYSKNKNEVIDTMDFFVTANVYDIENTKVGIRRMLHLVWMKSNDEEGNNIADNLVRNYETLFLSTPPEASALEAAAFIAKNLIKLTYEATVPELASLERLLGLMYEAGMINDNVIKVLWQIYNFQDQNFSRKQRRGSIIVLGMLALSNHEIAVKGVDALLAIGLGPKGKDDLVLAKYSCTALNRAVPRQRKETSSDRTNFRIGREDDAIRALVKVLVDYNDNSEYYSLAEQAINTVFNLAHDPESVATHIIREKTKLTFSQPVEGQSQVISLSQLLFIVGHIAIKMVVHLEALEAQFKKKKIEAEMNKDKGKKDDESHELEMIGGTSEDDFADAVNFIKEKELLFGESSILAKFGPLVKTVCQYSDKYDNAILQRSAVSCFEKLMCVSSKYCEDNLQLLLTIMEKSQDPVIRSNSVLGLGDMTVCFNNLIDENTDFLYRRLHDEDLMVKRTALMTITFLILAGQVKVKGQLFQMAKLLEDENQNISDMSRLFFTELATKDNAIYNGFIDIFSGLSNDEDLEKEARKRILKFLIGFIDKERHQKQLSEKLVQRLAKVENQEKWNHIAFALNTLPNKTEEISKLLEAGYNEVSSKE